MISTALFDLGRTLVQYFDGSEFPNVLEQVLGKESIETYVW